MLKVFKFEGAQNPRGRVCSRSVYQLPDVLGSTYHSDAVRSTRQFDLPTPPARLRPYPLAILPPLDEAQILPFAL